jgi:hypothetical protein
MACPIAPDAHANEEEEEEDSNWDDSDDVAMSDSRSIPPLTDFCLDDLPDDILDGFTALQATDEWKAADSYRMQIAMIVQALHFGPMKATFIIIARMVGKSKAAVFKKYEKSQQQARAHGRPCLLSESDIEAMRMFVLDCFEKGIAATYEAIAHFLDSEMSIQISLDTLRHIVHRHPDSKTVVGIPMERERVEVDSREIGECYDRLRSEVTGLPSAMVFNLDETGHQEWADKHDIRVVIPVSYESESIHVPCDRSSKRASLLVCIAADGTFVRLLVIVPRLTVDQEVYEIRYTPDRVMLEYQENGFISTQLFDKWVIDVFFPHVEDVRRKIGYGGGESSCWMSAPATIQMNFLTCAMILGLCQSFSLPTHLI